MERRDPNPTQAIRERVARYRWYHRIDLGEDLVTPGRSDLEPVWDNIRLARKHLDYRQKRVLDIGSMEGLWAFEAEKLGAGIVIATDCFLDHGSYGDPLEKFLICRAILRSEVLPYYNVSPYRLRERLDILLQEGLGGRPRGEQLFDIVEHRGVLYHLRDPLLSLAQARSVLRDGGHMLMETVVVAEETASYMVFNGVPPDRPRIYQGVTTWWAPTIKCLLEMLRACLFLPLAETMSLTPRYAEENLFLQRAALVCQAVGEESVPPNYYAELTRTYRNPGLSGFTMPATGSAPST